MGWRTRRAIRKRSGSPGVSRTLYPNYTVLFVSMLIGDEARASLIRILGIDEVSLAFVTIHKKSPDARGHTFLALQLIRDSPRRAPPVLI